MAKNCVSAHFHRLADVLASVLTLYAGFADAEGITCSVAGDLHPLDHAFSNHLEDRVNADVAEVTAPGAYVSGGFP